MSQHPVIIDRAALAPHPMERFVCGANAHKGQGRFSWSAEAAYDLWASSRRGRFHKELHGFKACTVIVWTPHMRVI